MNYQVTLKFSEFMKAKINTGILAGLEDARACHSHEITDDYVTKLKQRLQKRLSDNSLPKAWKANPIHLVI